MMESHGWDVVTKEAKPPLDAVVDEAKPPLSVPCSISSAIPIKHTSVFSFIS